MRLPEGEAACSRSANAWRPPTTACLDTDLRNPLSNRIYAKIGFKPVYESWHYPRIAAHSQHSESP